MVKPIQEGDLHAYVDELLPQERRDEVEAYLALHPDDAQRVRAWIQQKQALHALYDEVLSEPVPRHHHLPLSKRLRPLLRHAAVIIWFAVGGVLGWYLNGYNAIKNVNDVTLARQAAIAHAVYSPEVRHPVEVGADQEAHLVKWLSKRLGANLKIPQLSELGYQLVGGRLLPDNVGPVAQFMFQDSKGVRLTLYVRIGASEDGETAFRYAQEGGISVFYWLDGRFSYALSGEVDKSELLRIAKAVYQQLDS